MTQHPRCNIADAKHHEVGALLDLGCPLGTHSRCQTSMSQTTKRRILPKDDQWHREGLRIKGIPRSCEVCFHSIQEETITDLLVRDSIDDGFYSSLIEDWSDYFSLIILLFLALLFLILRRLMVFCYKMEWPILCNNQKTRVICWEWFRLGADDSVAIASLWKCRNS